MDAARASCYDVKAMLGLEGQKTVTIKMAYLRNHTLQCTKQYLTDVLDYKYPDAGGLLSFSYLCEPSTRRPPGANTFGDSPFGASTLGGFGSSPLSGIVSPKNTTLSDIASPTSQQLVSGAAFARNSIVRDIPVPTGTLLPVLGSSTDVLRLKKQLVHSLSNAPKVLEEFG